MNKLRVVSLVLVLIAVFALGRYSAFAAGQIPMKIDQFLVSMGMVKVTMGVVQTSQERIQTIAKNQMSGKLTKSQALKAFDQAIQSQEAQVGTALMQYVNRNMAVSKDYMTGPDQLSNDMLNTVEYLQTKFPTLFGRFMN